MEPTPNQADADGPDGDFILLQAVGDGRYSVLGETFDSADDAGRYLTRELVRAYYPEWLDRVEAPPEVPAPPVTPVPDEAPPPARPAHELTAVLKTVDGARAVLRPATPADAARVAELANALDREVGDATEPHTAETVAEGMLGGEAGMILWVVEPEEGGGAVGYALVQDMYDTDGADWAAWLHDLYIDGTWRSRNIGERMMAHLALVALRDGHNGLWWGVHRNNWKAERFYRRLGAHRAPIHVMGVAGPTLAALAAKAA